MMDDVRILKGWTKDERKELEEAKDTENLGDFLHSITEYLEDTNYSYVWDNYHKAEENEQISIIEDILDFYTDKAKFLEQKYYVKLSKIGFPYLVQTDDGMELVRYLRSGYKEKFTENEIKAIDPRYMAFAVPVEADDE